MVKNMTDGDWAWVIEHGDWSSHPMRTIAIALRDDDPPLKARTRDGLVRRVLSEVERFAWRWVRGRKLNEGALDLVGETRGFVDEALSGRKPQDLDHLCIAFVKTLENFMRSAYRKWCTRNKAAPMVSLGHITQVAVENEDADRRAQLLIELGRTVEEFPDKRIVDILERRAHKETLESIGFHHGITEGAVRAILASFLKRLKGKL